MEPVLCAVVAGQSMGGNQACQMALANLGTCAWLGMFNRTGIRHVYFESSGTAHEWLTWRRSLNDFAPRLFRQ